jgi:PilZ domain
MADCKSERRSIQRMPVRVGVSVRSAQSQSGTAYTRDLSTSGIFLYADSEILVGSELEMVLMLPAELTDGEKRWVCCKASVLRVEQGGEYGRFGVAASIRSIATLPEIGS